MSRQPSPENPLVGKERRFPLQVGHLTTNTNPFRSWEARGAEAETHRAGRSSCAEAAVWDN